MKCGGEKLNLVCACMCVCEVCQGIWLQKKECTQRRPGWAGG